MEPTIRVSQDVWADYVSDFFTTASEQNVDDVSRLLYRLPNRAVLGMVRYYPDGSKCYSIRPGGHEQYPQYLVNPLSKERWRVRVWTPEDTP